VKGENKKKTCKIYLWNLIENSHWKVKVNMEVAFIVRNEFTSVRTGSIVRILLLQSCGTGFH
jgi:hypothetical protein